MVLEIMYLLLDVSLYLNYLRAGVVLPQVPIMCLLWWLASNGIHETITILMAWAAFERHILIFNSQLVATKRKRLLVHYLPVACILVYGSLFYGTAIFFPPCQNTYEYHDEWCAESCLFNNTIFVIYQLVMNEILCTVLIVVVSLALLVRIIWQKKTSLNQPMNWRKYRRMTIQLLAMVAPYFFFHLPEMIIVLIKPFDLTSEFGQKFEVYMNFIGFGPELLLPFVCLAALYPKPWDRRNRLITAETMLKNQTVLNNPTVHD
jgi:hypothetical protein